MNRLAGCGNESAIDRRRARMGEPARLQMERLRAPAREEGFTRTIRRGGALMGQEFDVVVERDGEGFYVASVPTLPGCHTQARSLDELMERIKEAIQLCLEVQGDATEKLDFVGVQRVRLAS